MGSFLFTAASFIVALGILITVHEFGHFWVARKLGVKVLRFSVGFGKPLFKWSGKDGETEYMVAAIPLGGYVKMLDEREGEVPEAEIDRAFNRQSLAVRSAVVFAGPAFNLLFAIFAFWLVFVSGDTGIRPLIGEVAEDSIAAAAGFQAEDELISIDGRETLSWEAVYFTLMQKSVSGEDLHVSVRDRSGSEVSYLLPGAGLAKMAESGQLLERLGITRKWPKGPPVIGMVLEGEPAQRSGLRKGDRVLAVDNIELTERDQLLDYIGTSPGKEVLFEVERDTGVETIPVLVGRKHEDTKIGRIGAVIGVADELREQFRAENLVEIRYGPLEAFPKAVTKTWDMSLFMLRMLGRMVMGEASVENLGGPITIAQTAGKTASIGLTYFIKFLALVSISLGILNLLPIPVLDGGHLLFFLLEAIKGSPLSEQAHLWGMKVGITLLVALMGLAFYIDISRLLG